MCTLIDKPAPSGAVGTEKSFPWSYRLEIAHLQVSLALEVKYVRDVIFCWGDPRSAGLVGVWGIGLGGEDMR